MVDCFKCLIVSITKAKRSGGFVLVFSGSTWHTLDCQFYLENWSFSGLLSSSVFPSGSLIHEELVIEWIQKTKITADLELYVDETRLKPGLEGSADKLSETLCVNNNNDKLAGGATTIKDNPRTWSWVTAAEKKQRKCGTQPDLSRDMPRNRFENPFRGSLHHWDVGLASPWTYAVPWIHKCWY